MFFAAAPSSPQLAGDLLDELSRHLKVSPDARLYALVDSLLVPDIADLCRQHGWPEPLPVYAGHPGYDSGRQWSPCLLELPSDLGRLAPYLSALVGSFPVRFVEVPAALSARHNPQRRITHATATQPDFCLPD